MNVVAMTDPAAALALAAHLTVGAATAAWLLPRTGRRWDLAAVGWALTLVVLGPLSLFAVAGHLSVRGRP